MNRLTYKHAKWGKAYSVHSISRNYRQKHRATATSCQCQARQSNPEACVHMALEIRIAQFREKLQKSVNYFSLDRIEFRVRMAKAEIQSAQKDLDYSIDESHQRVVSVYIAWLTDHVAAYRNRQAIHNTQHKELIAA